MSCLLVGLKTNDDCPELSSSSSSLPSSLIIDLDLLLFFGSGMSGIPSGTSGTGGKGGRGPVSGKSGNFS